MSDRNEDRIWSAIESIRISMMATTDGSLLRARPMQAIPRREEGVIWFFTDVTDAKDDEIRAHPQVCLAFADVNDKTYVSVSGRVVLVDDRAKTASSGYPRPRPISRKGRTTPTSGCCASLPSAASSGTVRRARSWWP